jgi:hypothetical protein
MKVISLHTITLDGAITKGKIYNVSGITQYASDKKYYTFIDDIGYNVWLSTHFKEYNFRNEKLNRIL